MIVKSKKGVEIHFFLMSAQFHTESPAVVPPSASRDDRQWRCFFLLVFYPSLHSFVANRAFAQPFSFHILAKPSCSCPSILLLIHWCCIIEFLIIVPFKSSFTFDLLDGTLPLRTRSDAADSDLGPSSCDVICFDAICFDVMCTISARESLSYLVGIASHRESPHPISK